MKTHFFRKFEFEFETYRLLWYSAAEGSDFAEVTSTTEKIKDGNHESWFKEWCNLAEKLENRANDFLHPITRGNAYLRASRYYQIAEFFLHPHDSRKRKMYDKSVELFYQGLDDKQVNYIFNSVLLQSKKI
ncbi:hypothetical protein [Staphylococcus equorum]|uniref:hypothetical protein n=1 Tax=Staphylococcus equorum TaxID=246432 RepID=UPI003F558BD2